ncbi:nodulation protein NfeD [Phenylobacterium sp.]|uniref:NfeD family protein n=1 Tax=Phenylobacterium sp. TaxID=1871053 RepID=UPI00289F406C|nr:nodulation protein NfeD [Phenylobacterium sp.]
MTSSGGAASRKLLGLVCGLLIALGMAMAAASAPSRDARAALVLHIDGAIGPASADYLRQGMAQAKARGAQIIVLRIDTPGGLDASMRQIIREIIASPVPVLAYVAPGGARAASAGTYIVYASHVAAMAPGTNLGAATPVEIGAVPGVEPAGGQPKDKAAPEAGRGAMEAKAVNDAAAYIRGLAHLRGRNADWAERAAREAASLDAADALAAGVIDIVARDIPDALAQADGRMINVAGAQVALDTKALAVEHLRPGWRHELLGAIANPNVALILMMIGVYGLLFEFMNPGSLYPGTIGAICLMIGLYALAVLPVNYAGLALVLLGIGLMTAEAFAPSFGALGLGGAAAFLVGAMILIDTDAPGLRVSFPLVASLAAAGLAFALLVMREAFSARRRAIVSGREAMIGAPGVVQAWSGRQGFVFAHGERWRAVSSTPLKPGERVRTLGVDGLTLTVSPDENAAPPTDEGIS